MKLSCANYSDRPAVKQPRLKQCSKPNMEWKPGTVCTVGAQRAALLSSCTLSLRFKVSPTLLLQQPVLFASWSPRKECPSSPLGNEGKALQEECNCFEWLPETAWNREHEDCRLRSFVCTLTHSFRHTFTPPPAGLPPSTRSPSPYSAVQNSVEAAIICPFCDSHNLCNPHVVSSSVNCCWFLS